MYHFDLHHTNHTTADTYFKAEHVDRTYILAAFEEEKREKRNRFFRRLVELLKKERTVEDEECPYQSARMPMA